MTAPRDRLRNVVPAKLDVAACFDSSSVLIVHADPGFTVGALARIRDDLHGDGKPLADVLLAPVLDDGGYRLANMLGALPPVVP